ncbi:hypothetical protein M5D96_007565 [Drosophila gunungcola]|uniref:Uncharacterized protein n=2 Tax=Drosophila gunungcola TaxID=103775 RepID=A0A9P9YN79_9MUSC|nr:hypothetical protein M5D96_007565 [Drosophila gunungcola]
MVLTGHGCAPCLMSNPLRKVSQRLMNIYPNYLSLRQITVLPNDGNKVLIPMSDPFEMKTLNRDEQKASFQPLPTRNATAEHQKKLLDPPLRVLPCCCVSTGRCSQMDGRTVKMALAVMDQKNVAEQRRKQEQVIDKRKKDIDDKLEQILRLLQDRR